MKALTLAILTAAITLAPLLAYAQTPIEITAPADGAVVPEMFTVKVSFTDVEYCDTDGCYGIPPDSVSLHADSAAIASCVPTMDCSAANLASFDVELAEGMHSLVAFAVANSAGPEESAPVQVTVDQGAQGGGPGNDEEGCGCSERGPHGAALPLLAVPLLSLRRRTRRP